MSVCRLILLGALGLFCLVGCGESGPTRQPIYGSVTIDGAKLEHGAISLRPAAGTSAPAAVAPVENGKYRFTRKTGPLPGTYSIKINVDPESEQGNAIISKSTTGSTVPAAKAEVGPKGGSLEIPVRPRNRQSQPAKIQPKLHWELQYTVPEDGSTEKNFDLTS